MSFISSSTGNVRNQILLKVCFFMEYAPSMDLYVKLNRDVTCNCLFVPVSKCCITFTFYEFKNMGYNRGQIVSQWNAYCLPEDLSSGCHENVFDQKLKDLDILTLRFLGKYFCFYDKLMQHRSLCYITILTIYTHSNRQCIVNIKLKGSTNWHGCFTINTHCCLCC